ncbi:hypothetical protein [Jannaschia sp. W003]|uniref:hypothetical protein n=1 Tax=Jannaschia sp. W003 TaxID=2867012 RepID=UPI0021A30325|nr:hypothetical protein [Jannaschia sp. W003]UWQ23192.1 hypothetical protein K3554_16765 [Jannaschia sp. W003]
MTEASRADLEGRVDDFLLRRMGAGPFRLRRLVPVPGANRFDLGFKLAWLDARARGGAAWADGLYERHLAAFSLGDMREPGSDKHGIARFRGDFEALARDIAAGGFDPERSLVPLAADGTLLNGGHRAACAIAAGREVAAVETGLEPMRFDHRFFADRGMAEADLDAAAIRMIEAMPHAAVALLWPAARGRDGEAARILGPLVYRRAVPLSPEGGHVLLSRVYRGEPWLGAPEADFPGIRRKRDACFAGSDTLRVLVFDAPPDRDRVALKAEVRALYGIDKSSIHITDTHAEAVEIAHLLLNPSARHFLEHGAPMRFERTRAHLGAVGAWMAGHRMAPDAFAVDTGMVLGLYGLRAPDDVDVVSPAPLPPGPVERHEDAHRGAPPAEVLSDPALHFRFAGITFASLAAVAALKRRRLAGRDREDLLRIEPLLAATAGGARPAPPASLRWRFAMLRVRRAAIRGLMAVGLGPPLRRAWRRLRPRA